jgi:hypothetical protein
MEDQKLIDLYLDYCNDFLTIECFAEYHNLSVNESQSIIARGKVKYLSQNPSQRLFFTLNMKPMNDVSPTNAAFFKKRYEDKLLSEHSA